jgi:tetratricopeptide (TPR) repeat protein
MRARFLCSLLIMVLGTKGFAVISPTICGAQDSERIVLTMPGLSWALEIKEGGFSVKGKNIDPQKGTAKLLAEDPWTQTTITAYIERAVKKGGAKACRDYHWWQIRKTPFSLKDAHLYESGPMAILEYSLPKVGTTTINQKYVNAYMAMDEYWISVELAQSFHDPLQGDALKSILEHITIDTAYVPTVQEDFGYGSYYFLKKDYRKAAKHYERVLERKDPGSALNRNSWRALVDQLGMSYGLSGELARAKELFEWAVTQDAEYPMFYYNLACTFAEMGDLESALGNLRLAYQYKGNMLSKETFPDPKKDPSFKKLLKDKKFRAELDKLK